MTTDPQPPPPKSGLSAFWAELKRRKVMRVANTYAVVAWLIIQIAVSTFEGFGIPVWAFRFVVIMLGLFFPVAIILAWAFELTPDGIKTTKVAQAERGDEPVSKKQQRKRNWFTFLLGAAVPTIIFGTLAFYFYVTRSGGDGKAEIGDKSIAVLPLENMSPDPDNAFFADGVQEDILTNLSKIDALGLVISRSSSLKYRDPNRNLKQVGQELGVRYIVEGSVRRAANQVLVTVQLIDSQTDDHIWAENYNRELEDIFAIQAEVAKEIARQLRAAISTEEIAKIEYRPTENQEAYDNFVRCRQLLDADEGTWEVWISLLEKAVSLDPNFAEAWAYLAVEYTVKWARGENRNDPELIDKAHQALANARRLKPGSAYVPFAQSFIARWEVGNEEENIKWLAEAVAIDPGFARAQMFLGMAYSRLGRLSEAQQHLEAAVRTDPLSPFNNHRLLSVYKSREYWEKARTLIQSHLDRGYDKDSWERRMAELEYYQFGNTERLISALTNIPSFKDNPRVIMMRELQSQNYEGALLAYEDVSVGQMDTFGFLSGTWSQTYLSPSDLVSALLFFELRDKEKYQKVANELKKKLENILKQDPLASPAYRSNLTICYALLEDRTLVDSTVAKAREQTRYTRSANTELHIAIAYLVLGDHDKAIETLEAASKMDGPIFLNRELDLWFIFDRLRGNPRFDALLED